MKHSIFHTTPFALACTLCALLSLACGQPAAETSPEDTSPEPAAQTPASSAADEGEGAGSDEVTFEPAYPTDVSTEGLDAEDTAQQQTHSHGDGEHSHGDGDHSHGDDSHTHGEEGHDEDGHSHGDGDEHEH